MLTTCLSLGEQNLAKYHDESTKVSNVSVSLIAFLEQFGHLVSYQFFLFSSGLPTEFKSISSGNLTGSCSDGTGTVPQ